MELGNVAQLTTGIERSWTRMSETKETKCPACGNPDYDEESGYCAECGYDAYPYKCRCGQSFGYLDVYLSHKENECQD